MAYACSRCSKTFKQDYALAQHVESVHGHHCETCDRKFYSERAFENHFEAVHCHYCETCDRKFYSERARDDHVEAVHRHYCKTCDRKFRTEGARDNHVEASHGYRCETCDRKFRSEEACNNHWEAVHKLECYQDPCEGKRFANIQGLAQHLQFSNRHRYDGKRTGKSNYHCHECEANFSFQYAFDIHNQAYEHEIATQFTCCDCDRDFNTQAALDSHLKDKVHATRKVLTTTMCTICNKDLKTEKALESHMSSTVHKGLPSPKCPSCGQEFSIPSALVHHLESGKCKSGITKQILDATMIEHDRSNVITMKNKLLIQPTVFELTGDYEIKDDQQSENGLITPSESDGGVPLLTPTSSRSASFSRDLSGLLTPSSNMSAQDVQTYNFFNSFDRDDKCNLICSLCPDSRKFCSMQALQAHIFSFAHAPKIYKCPTDLFINLPGDRKRHSRKFTSLSGLTQHLESEACHGGRAGFNLAFKFLEGKFKELGFGSKWIDMGLGRAGKT